MSTKLMIKLKVWSNSSSSKLGRRFGWPMPYFSVALVFLPFFPSVPRFTSKQPQPLDSGIAPAGDGHLSQEEGFLWEVIDYSRRLLQGLLIRPSGLPSACLPTALHACSRGPPPHCCLYSPGTLASSIALPCSPDTAFWLPTARWICPLACLVLGLHGSTFHTLALSIRNCAAQFFFVVHLLLTYLDLFSGSFTLKRAGGIYDISDVHTN